MEVVSKRDRDQAIKRFPQKFFDLCSGKFQHEFIEIMCDTELENIYGSHPEGGQIPLDQEEVPEAKLIPLWGQGISFILYRMGRKNEFVEIDLEDPFSPHRISETIQGVLAYILFRVIEDLEGAENLRNNPTELKELEKLAAALDFRYLHELIDLQDKIGGESFDQCEELLSKFINTLED